MTFTPNEIEYLGGQRLGRLATVGANGEPHNVPVGFPYNTALGPIDLGVHNRGKSRKFRDVEHQRRVAFVVDDLASITPWTPRGIEIRGTAEALRYGGESLGPGFGAEIIRIYPRSSLARG